MYHTLLEGVWVSDIGRMAEVRNVPHLARTIHSCLGCRTKKAGYVGMDTARSLIYLSADGD